ncbi:MAG: penicillin acylase family protein [Chitinophagales bacterium]|nr:penicillin acylase family protein [Chitinophagales bacterium]
MKRIFFTLVIAFIYFKTQSQNTYPTINPVNVSIVRDSFGIPHIFAKTDAEVAYGLAWANAEDAFHISQELIYAAAGFGGRHKGIEGAKSDYFVHAIGAREFVKQHQHELSTEFKKYLNGFTQGLNAYAKAHPKDVRIKSAFPLKDETMLVAYVAMMSLLCGAQNNVGDAIAGKYDELSVPALEQKTEPIGSNAFAVSAKITENGKTFLCINPHMYMEGMLSFYEAHLHSEEGLNMEGAMFQASTSLAMGVNENLGWGMTWNYFDRLDVYKLKMHPDKKLQYEFDGQWLTLEKKPVWLKVNLAKKGKFVLPVKQMAYWSKYGMTIKSKKSENYYAIRFPGNMTIKTGQQLYEMNKAKTFEDFRKAIDHQSLALFNIVYADKEDNLFYIHHGMMPNRQPGFDWKGILPGNTSKTLWTSFTPLSKMQQVKNPECGYIFNTNNTPYNATCTGNNCVANLPSYADERPGNNMRANRMMEYFDNYSRFSWQLFKQMKFDVTFPKSGKFIESISPLFNLDDKKYADIAEAIGILKNWNRQCNIDEYAPTLLGTIIDPLIKAKKCEDGCFVMGVNTNEEELVGLLRSGCDSLKKYFGTVKVKWGDVNRLVRGNVNLPLRGFADVLSPTFPVRMKEKPFQFKAKHGDTYTMFAAFDKNGVSQLEAVQPLGNSSRENSPYYTNQMELFTQQKTRTLSLKKEEVMQKAAMIYHPQ